MKKLTRPFNLDAGDAADDWIKLAGVRRHSFDDDLPEPLDEEKRFREFLHPRDPFGRFKRRGFDVVAVDPVADLNGHVGKPWYGVDDWSEVGVDLPKHMRIAKEYDRLPDFDEGAIPAYKQFLSELDEQYDLLTNKLGYTVEVTKEDPYADVHELIADLRENKRIKVLATASTPPGHPFLTDDENDRFRAVHDAFGHAGTGRGFDRHGEEAAYQAHANMFSDLARRALATETRGQNAALIRGVEETGVGAFVDQKFALLDEPFTKNFFPPKDSAVSADTDNATEISGSHHVTGGRWIRKVSAEEQEAVENRRNVARLKAGLPVEQKDFDPNQPRGPHGRWVRAAGDVLRDVAQATDVKATSPKVEQAWGKGVDAMFGTAEITPAPWPHSARYKDRGDYDLDLVRSVLSSPDTASDLQAVDPRTLHSYQPSITRAGVDYYAESEDYRRFGTTFEPGENRGNRYPVIYIRDGANGLPGQSVILSGHHRAAAALAKGEALQALVIKGGWGAPR